MSTDTGISSVEHHCIELIEYILLQTCGSTPLLEAESQWNGDIPNSFYNLNLRGAQSRGREPLQVDRHQLGQGGKEDGLLRLCEVPAVGARVLVHSMEPFHGRKLRNGPEKGVEAAALLCLPTSIISGACDGDADLEKSLRASASAFAFQTFCFKDKTSLKQTAYAVGVAHG